MIFADVLMCMCFANRDREEECSCLHVRDSLLEISLAGAQLTYSSTVQWRMDMVY
jgi:hypothetical protein